MGIEFNPNEYLIKQPEQVFSVPTLIHTTAEISSIIEHFSRADRRPSYACVIVLLEAMKKFRMDTSSTGTFARQIGDTQGLDKVFQRLETALSLADKERKGFAGIDKEIMSSAIRYCRASVINRIHSRLNDKAFLVCWDKSDLKIAIESSKLNEDRLDIP